MHDLKYYYINVDFTDSDHVNYDQLENYETQELSSDSDNSKFYYCNSFINFKSFTSRIYFKLQI